MAAIDEQRGFAGAVCAQQRDDLAGVAAETTLVENAAAAEVRETSVKVSDVKSIARHV